MLTKEQKEKVRRGYTDVWKNDEHMINWCVGQVATIAEFSNGDFITVDKQKIDKDFCFGESGYDYDDAAAMAHHASTSENYFKKQNMKWAAEWLETINEQYDLHNAEYPSMPNVVLTIAEKPYIGQSQPAKLKNIVCWRASEILDAMGSSAYVRELPGAHFEKWEAPYRIPTLGELNAIRAAYEQAAKEHEKKVDSYLKRYGLSKVNAWTYWRDA